MVEYTRIMAAVDQAPTSRTVVQRAQAIAKQCAAHLSVLHVIDQRGLVGQGRIDSPLFGVEDQPLTPDAHSVDEAAHTPQTDDHQMIDTAHGFLTTLVVNAGASDAECLVRVSASVGREIVAVARQHQIGLIVCGAYQRHGLALLLRSTAERVVRDLPCDVLLIKLEG
ncbi:MAG: universal stress protein [Hyphomicrobiales bacterium]|nr:universal stress protein [Hyphomicrobiales bacterium]